jgi:hypothetical protein
LPEERHCGLLPSRAARRQALECINRGFGGVLSLQVGLEDVDIVIKPLQVLLLDSGDALQHFDGVEAGLGVGERVGGSGRRLAFDRSPCEVVSSAMKEARRIALLATSPTVIALRRNTFNLR